MRDIIDPSIAKYTTTTITIREGLEALLNCQPAEVPIGYLDSAINLFSLAHSYYESEEFAVIEEEIKGPVVVRILDSMHAKNFILSAYGKTNDEKEDEKVIREGLYLTECLPKIFKDQKIPRNSIEDFRKLRDVYARLNEIANREWGNERFSDIDDE